MADRPRVLVVSFSPIHTDARVLRQLSVVARRAHVTTIGYGPRPAGSDEHLRLPDGVPSLPQTARGVALLAARRWGAAELAAPASRHALRLGAGGRWDAVVANDARALPVAHRLAAGAPVWADLHEWAPEERSHVTSWRLLVAPLMDHLCRTYLPRCAATTTVAASIADLYAERYGVRPRVMRNAAPWADLSPTAVDGPTIRLVHSGGAIPGRSLETMLDVVGELGEGWSLDLYLMPGGDGGRYLRSLQDRAAGLPGVTFHAPVAPEALPATLNRYDVGVFWIPPFNANAARTLPNKLFDFVQARLAVAVGPSPEMARVVSDHGLGVVAGDFSAGAAAASLARLSREQVTGFKAAAHAASRELSFATEAAVADDVLDRLLR
ncbi:glycosyltransferase family protein [Georgenia satyanarayanai]|uniref:hypothetical protein n=1 Tax=Georgenia satyanarayanai TaxID=860221 RepID=UPI00126588B1|nr:hypothetical protein [Georgenia satyanarayanai]